MSSTGWSSIFSLHNILQSVVNSYPTNNRDKRRNGNFCSSHDCERKAIEVLLLSWRIIPYGL